MRFDPEVVTAARRAEKFLRPLQGKGKRQGLVVYDYESKDDDSGFAGWTRPFLLSFYDGQEVKFFENDPLIAIQPWELRHLEPSAGLTDLFLRFLFGMGGSDADVDRYQSHNALIYAHNGGKFDHLFILGWLRQHHRLFDFEIASVQSRIQKLDVWHKGTSKKEGFWSFVDSISLLPMSLEKMGETFCKGAFEKWKWDLNTPEDHPGWKWYCGQDVVVAYRSLVAFHDLIESLGGQVGLTSPSTAMDLYRRRFLPQEKWIERNQHFPDCPKVCLGCERKVCDKTCHGCAHEWVRRGYYGGRTEVFARNSVGKNLSYYDINSSYPASMMDPMPAGEMKVITSPVSMAYMRELRRSHIGFVECDVEVPRSCMLPPLPFRHPSGKLVFPCGDTSGEIKFTGVWDWDELQLLDHPLVNGRITKIYRSTWYKQRPIFRNFITTLYDLRAANKKTFPGLAEVCKLMMNSAYGKFGMNPERTGILMCEPGDSLPKHAWPLGGEPEEPNGDTARFWEVERFVDAAYIVPQISAHVTALSRIRLFLGMADIVMRGGSVYYCDTDSVLTDLPLSDEFLDDAKLGMWKNEEPDALLSGHFVRPKLYLLTAHRQGCLDDDCDGCFFKWHLPGCKKETCPGPGPGCTAKKTRMKGVPARVQTPDTFAALLRGEVIKFDRVQQHRTMLKHPQGVTVMANKITYDEWREITGDGRVFKSIRTPYDKRIMDDRTGLTVPIWLGQTG